MKVIHFKKKSTSLEIARNLLVEATKNEPEITRDLKSIIDSTKATSVGFKNKFKSEDSLNRKIFDRSLESGISLNYSAKLINDSLRYTLLADKDSYAEILQQVKSQFIKKGYKIKREFNAWQIGVNKFDTGYRGVNLTIISSQNQKFELQFHTGESFKFKTKTHSLYTEFRNPQVSEERKFEIRKFFVEKALKLKRPEGI